MRFDWRTKSFAYRIAITRYGSWWVHFLQSAPITRFDPRVQTL